MPDARLRKLLAEALRAPEGNTVKHSFERMMANPANVKGPPLPQDGNTAQGALQLNRLPADNKQLPVVPTSPDGAYSAKQAQAVIDPYDEETKRKMMLLELQAALEGDGVVQ
jgi:hypothetical protein